MKKDLRRKIEKAQYVSLCADFWTGKNSIGYLGITATILENGKRSNFLIGLRHVEHPHTASVVQTSIEKVISEFGLSNLDDAKLVSISTDNGSNMVAGIKNFVSFPGEFENVEPSDDDEDYLDDESDEEIEDVFSRISYKKRIACTNHILNNNLKYGIKHTQNVSTLMIEAKDKIKSLKNIGVVVDFMVKNKLSKFKLPPLTRWQYFFEMTNALISLKSKMPEICSLAKVDNLTISQYEKIESLNKILTIYAHQIKRFEANDSKLSDAIPALLNLIAELDDHSVDHFEFVSNLKRDLIKRTKCIFDPTCTTFNSIFSIATYTDPSVRKYFGASIQGVNMEFLKEFVRNKLKKITSKPEDQMQPKVSKVSFSKLDSILSSENLPRQDELLK